MNKPWLLWTECDAADPGDGDDGDIVAERSHRNSAAEHAGQHTAHALRRYTFTATIQR